MTEQNSTTASTTGPRVSVHRWPWRVEEFVSMAVAVALVVALGHFVFTARRAAFTGPLTIGWAAIVALAAIGAVYYLYRVKKKRTDTSQVTITLLGTVIRSESKGPLGKSQVDATKTRTVSYRRFNSDETFMISDGDQAARVPVRATSNPDVRQAVQAAFSTAENVSDEARDLLARMPDIKA